MCVAVYFDDGLIYSNSMQCPWRALQRNILCSSKEVNFWQLKVNFSGYARENWSEALRADPRSKFIAGNDGKQPNACHAFDQINKKLMSTLDLSIAWLWAASWTTCGCIHGRGSKQILDQHNQPSAYFSENLLGGEDRNSTYAIEFYVAVKPIRLQF